MDFKVFLKNALPVLIYDIVAFAYSSLELVYGRHGLFNGTYLGLAVIYMAEIGFVVAFVFYIIMGFIKRDAFWGYIKHGKLNN